MDRHANQPPSTDTSHLSHDGDDDIDTQADNFIEEGIHAHGCRIVDEGGDLDSRAERLILLVWCLMALLNQEMSTAWEENYRIRDLTEEVQRLRDALRDTVSYADRADPPLKPRTALEAMNERRVKVAEGHVSDLLSENWELNWRCRDLQERVRRLETQLRNSVSLSDAQRPPWKPKTALERALEKRILELERQIHNPKGRERSSTV